VRFFAVVDDISKIDAIKFHPDILEPVANIRLAEFSSPAQSLMQIRSG
jgi:hypothetical protein